MHLVDGRDTENPWYKMLRVDNEDLCAPMIGRYVDSGCSAYWVWKYLKNVYPPSKFGRTREEKITVGHLYVVECDEPTFVEYEDAKRIIAKHKQKKTDEFLDYNP